MANSQACVTGSAEVRVFCSSVSESTASSITLLKAIEHTVRWLTLLQNRARGDSKFASQAAQDLRTCERVKSIDTDGTLCVIFEQTIESIEKLHQLLIRKRESARTSPELNGEHKMSVVDEYTTTISDIADLHSSMTELKWAVGEHDADLEKPENLVFSDRDKLKEYLKAL